MAGLGLEPDNCNVLDASAASRVSHNRHSLSSETLPGKEEERAGRRGYGPLFEGLQPEHPGRASPSGTVCTLDLWLLATGLTWRQP